LLDPTSPLIDEINFPEGFDVQTTPLVTFRRVDLLVSRGETLAAHRKLGGKLDNTTLLSTEELYTMSPEEYLRAFLAPLPTGGYRTLIANTAAHWTTHLFIGGHRPGMDGVLELFEVVMTEWTSVIQEVLREANAQPHGGRDFRAVVRGYTPGHNNCQNTHYPLQEVLPFKTGTYNWDDIATFNEIMEVRRMVRSPEADSEV